MNADFTGPRGKRKKAARVTLAARLSAATVLGAPKGHRKGAIRAS